MQLSQNPPILVLSQISRTVIISFRSYCKSQLEQHNDHKCTVQEKESAIPKWKFITLQLSLH